MEKGRLLQNKNMNKAIQVSKITLIINLSLSLLKFAGFHYSLCCIGYNGCWNRIFRYQENLFRTVQYAFCP